MFLSFLSLPQAKWKVISVVGHNKIKSLPSVAETLEIASFHGNSETMQLQGCGTAEPCIRKGRYSMTLLQISILCYVNFNCKTFEIKTKDRNCIDCKGKTQPSK